MTSSTEQQAARKDTSSDDYAEAFADEWRGRFKEFKEIPLAEITIVTRWGESGLRAELHKDTIYDYAVAMRGMDSFPEMSVFWDGTNYLLADGYMRYHAARLIGLKQFRCMVYEGTESDALSYAVQINSGPRTPHPRYTK